MTYPLGTVSTPTGLSHTVNLSYGGTFSGGTNSPHVSGVPYGEGWNVSIPSISVSSEAYHKYSYDFIRANNNCFNDNYFECLSFDQGDLRKEGDPYWFAPTLSIPGVASGRLVYKARGGSGAIFVLNEFEEYVEAHFNGSTWTVFLPSGIRYEFTVTQAAERGATNQQVDYALTEARLSGNSNEPFDITQDNAQNILENILPKTEVVNWYVTQITNPNLLGDVIRFEYEKHGKKDYYKELYQYWLKKVINQYLILMDNSGDELTLSPPYILKGDTEICHYNQETGMLECPDSGDSACVIDTSPESLGLDYPNIICDGEVIPCYYGMACGNNILTDDVTNSVANALLEGDAELVADLINLPSPEYVFFFENHTGIENLRENVVYSDIFLKKVKSECGAILIEQLDLDYETLNDTEVLSKANKMLLLSDSDVKSQDSLYNYKTVYHEGAGINPMVTPAINNNFYHYDDATLTSNFRFWKRYKHAMHPDIQNALSYQAWMASKTDPYQKNYSNCVSTYTKEDILTNFIDGDDDGIVFNHCFLESPVFTTKSAFTQNYIAGETYEVRSLIYSNHTGSALEKMCNFDINIVAAKGPDYSINCGGTGSISYNSNFQTGTSYLSNRKTSIFSTFNKAIKWNNKATIDKEFIYSSNYFTLPNLPNAYEGFYVQVGPANSDHIFNINPSELISTPIRCMDEGNVIGANNYNAYVNRLEDSGLNNSVRATKPIPANFGMGLPWYMVRTINDRLYTGTVDPENSFCGPSNNYYNNWWNYEDDDFLADDFTNKPTLADEDFSLNSVEIIRYSKNPYMLKSVKYYKLNGEVSNGNQDGMKLINEHRFKYDLETVVTYDAPSDKNINYEPSIKGGHNRNVFLLEKIIKVPVNPSSNIDNEINNNIATYPTFHFTYDVMDYSLAVTTGSNNKTTSVILPIKTMTNFLGGKTELTYHPLTADDMSIRYSSDNRIVHNEGGTLDMDFEIAQAYTNVMQFYPRVATKTIYDETDSRIWEYDYQTPYSINSGSPTLNSDHFGRNQHGNSEKGYGTVTVQEPIINGVNNYTVYEYYANPFSGQNIHLFGKPHYIKKYRGAVGNGQLIQKIEYDYETVLAYENYVYTGATIGTNKEYYNQISSTPPANWGDADYGSVSGLNTVYFYETYYAEDIYPDYLNSYFIKLNSQSTTNYDLESGNQYTTTTDYEYWEADVNGNAVGSGWEQRNFGSYEFGELQSTGGGPAEPQTYVIPPLNFDPSWQLFSAKTSSSNNIGIETETRNYYYYDQINTVGSYPDNFPALWFTVTDGNRERLSEQQTIQKSIHDDKILHTSTFYEYSDDWDIVNDMLPRQTIEVDISDIPPCDSLQIIAGNNVDSNGDCLVIDAPPCNCIKSFGGDIPSGYYQVFIGVISYHCRIAEPYVVNFNVDSAIINNNDLDPTGKYNLNDPLGSSLFLKKIDVRSSYEEAEEGIPYPYVGPNFELVESYYEYTMTSGGGVTTKEILERNRFGQVALEKNERGLQTKYEYSKFTPIFYSYGGAYNITHACYSKSVMFQENVGLPLKMTVGYEHEDSLIYHYSYNQDYSLSSITNPSGLTHSYAYDEYGRLKQTKKDTLLISEHDYSFWQNEDIGFEAKTDQNFTEAKIYVDSTQAPIITRNFVDPLGRSAGSLSQAGNITVASGQADYDKWNRATHAYKPHINGGDFIISSFTGIAYTKNVYEDDWNGRVTKSYKYGLDDTDPSMNYEYEFFTKIGLLLEIAEIGEIQEFAELIGPYSNTGSIFIKTVQRDEDNKPLITYSNTAGQTLISIQYANDTTSEESLITQFFYNSYGKIKKTINPKGQESQYIYGDFGQLVTRVTPDNGTTDYRYDISNLLIVEQDENGKNPNGNDNNYVRHYEYDIFGKTTKQERVYGIENNGSFGINSVRTSLFGGASNTQTSTVTDIKIEKEWFYHDNAELNTTDIFPQITQTMANTPSSYQGKLTFAKSYNNEGIPVIYHFYIYNELEQLRYEFQQCNPNGINRNTKGGLLAVGYPAYNLQNSVKIQNVYHGGGPDLQVQYRYTYDEWGRMENVYLSPRGGNGPINENHVLIASYNYKDDTGQLEKTNYYKGIECEVDSIEYQYDQRDRLTDINSALFQWQMLYDEANPSNVNNSNNYNGNINATIGTYTLSNTWNTPDDFDESTAYGYTYDLTNRLTQADSYVGDFPPLAIGAGAGDVTYNFDKIGNFTQLNRRSPTGSNTQIDYNYPTGNNRLESVNIGNDTHSIGYDANGNMLSNEQKGIETTEYGRANLPFSLENATNTKYLYDINDKRIYKQVRKGSTNLKEFYFRTATGDEVGVGDIYPIFVPNNTGGIDTLTQVDWTWYVHGIERIARFELEESRLAYSPYFERLICGVPYEEVLKMRQQKDSTGVSFEDREHEMIDKIQEIDWLHEKNQGILAALDRINLYIDSTNTEFYEIRMPQSDQVLELEMEDGDIQYTMQTTLDSILQTSFSINYQMIGSFAINDTKTPIPLTKTDNTISNELCLYELILSYTRADSARTIKPTVLPRQIPDIVNLTYYIHDHLGNTRVTYDKTGCSNRFNLQGVFDYYPYGKILREYQPNQTEKYLTTHHQRDEETTLDYRYARFYDSDLGRFLSIDPMAADYASWSDYGYVSGNPIYFTDPTGKDGEAIVDRANNTVTVNIKFHVSQTDISSLARNKNSKGPSNLNEIMNEFKNQYKSTEVKVNGVNYSVNFNLSFEIHDTDIEKLAAHDADKSLSANLFTVGGGPNRGHDDKFNFNPNQDNEDTFSHELGHILGLYHPVLHRVKARNRDLYEWLLFGKKPYIDENGDKKYKRDDPLIQGPLMSYYPKRKLTNNEVRNIVKGAINYPNTLNRKDKRKLGDDYKFGIKGK